MMTPPMNSSLSPQVESSPRLEKGFALAHNHYVSGRINASVASHGGISSISYIGRQDIKKSVFFKASELSSFTKLLRLYLIIDGQAYYPELESVRHYPFGYTAVSRHGELRVRIELVLDQNVVWQRLRVEANPAGVSVRARCLLHKHTAHSYAEREAGGWQIDEANGVIKLSVSDEDEWANRVDTQIVCGALASVRLQDTMLMSLETIDEGAEHCFYLSFNTDASTVPDPAGIDAVVRRYQNQLDEGLCLDSGNPIFDSAMNEVVPTVMSMALADCPGAVRASHSYWVWGWDSMVHSEALLWGGQTEIVRDMLDYYERSADPEAGIVHCLSATMRPRIIMRRNAQVMYVTTLYNYFAATGDRETVLRHMDFAVLLVERALSDRHADCELTVGKCFFPDEPPQLQQGHEDICLINNAVHYQALRSMEELCAAVGRLEASQRFAHLAQATGQALSELMWDDARHYWVDSLSGQDLSQRPNYPLYGIFPVSPFSTELNPEHYSSMARYMKATFRFNEGLYMFGPQEPVFMADGNQIGAYYPVVDRYYWTLMNRAEQTDAMDDLERIVSRFWSEQTYPEGMTHETVNPEPTSDSPGCKQAFSAKSWLCDMIELNFGLRVYLDGFSLNPLKGGRPLCLRNLTLQGKRIHFERKGEGACMVVLLNGKPMGDERIHWDMLEAENQIEISFA